MMFHNYMILINNFYKNKINLDIFKNDFFDLTLQINEEDFSLEFESLLKRINKILPQTFDENSKLYDLLISEEIQVYESNDIKEFIHKYRTQSNELE